MWWLWIVGPVWVAFLFVVAAKRDARRGREIAAWWKVARETPGRKKLARLPGSLQAGVASLGLSDDIAHYELVPGLAYLSVSNASFLQWSDFQSVVAKLDEKGPSFRVRPLANVEGQPEVNTGVEFKKDNEFMDTFVAEPIDELSNAERADVIATQGKAIRRWVSRPIRDALMEFPDLWLEVDGRVMTLATFGRVDPKTLDQLIVAADTIFAEHGADGGPSLLGDDEEDSDEGDTREELARA